MTSLEARARAEECAAMSFSHDAWAAEAFSRGDLGIQQHHQCAAQSWWYAHQAWMRVEQAEQSPVPAEPPKVGL
jgi:hypothetical protein